MMTNTVAARAFRRGGASILVCRPL